MSKWTGADDHKHWTDSANWHGGVPVAGMDAGFGAGIIATLVLARGSPLTTGAILLHGATVTLKGGTLNLAPVAATSGNTFDMQLGAGSYLTVAAGARVFGSNVARIGTGDGGATLTVQGLVAEAYGIVQASTFELSGTHGHWLSGDSGLAIESGTLVVADGARLDTGGHIGQFPAAALDMAGNSTALVNGPGSVVHMDNVFVSTSGGTSSLTVADGAHVRTGGGGIGGNGDGTLTVTGEGSLFQATRGLSVGGQVPVSSALVVEDGATVQTGIYGLSLDGTLTMDGSAHLVASHIVSGGAVIQALSGTVTLASGLSLYVNLSDPPETGTTYLEAAPGATLDLDGPVSTTIPGGSSALLEAASGHVVLSHASPSFEAMTGIYAATLEIAARNAIGSSELRFIAGAAQSPVLQIDSDLPFQNTIGGFANGDTIDLPGFACDLARFGFTPTQSGGMLQLTNAEDQHRQLVFGGSNLAAASFALIADGHGGTALVHF